MANSEALLIEVGTEELPPKSLKLLGEQFANNVFQALLDDNYSPESFEWFASPRRIAVLISNVADLQADSIVEKRGPAVKAAFDDKGEPTKAALGWAKGNGIEISDASRLVTDKGEWLLHKATQRGLSLKEKITPIITDALKSLPIPKPMRWGSSPFQFIRPVHTLCVMYGKDVLSASVFGVESSNILRGHRFHGQGTFSLTHAKEYENTLINHYVVGSFSRRVDTIKSAIDKQASNLGLIADYSVDLLEEIASLVEWPKIYQAQFEERFLMVPKEALIYTMKDDQKYVPLLNRDGTLNNVFLFVSNIDSKTPEYVIQGNEKVIRPRLADAEFFFNTDKKHTLASRLDTLSTVVFQKKLGTLRDKAERIANTASAIAERLDANKELAARAGLLCKTDLMSEMVMEFPEVQGVMGKYYALEDGEDIQVSQAMEEQYLPKFAGDKLPSTPVGTCVSLADKLDTLVGIFGIGQKPKGDKDPFALRRAAIGILRIISEGEFTLDIEELVSITASNFPAEVLQDSCSEVVDFILSRFISLLQEQNISTEVIQAVAVRRPTQPTDYVNRVKAVQTFSQLDASQALSAANKRVANILNKNAVDVSLTNIDSTLFVEPEEQALFDQLSSIDVVSCKDDIVSNIDHETHLSQLASLREAIDMFFDNVMVMADEDAVRNNRLALLNRLRNAFLITADISLLAT